MSHESVQGKPFAIGERNPVLLALIPVALFLLVALPDISRSLWQDEAFLLHNLGRGFLDFFAPLPFYDQAGPPLTLALLNQFYHWAGGEVMAMRGMILAFTGMVLAALAWKAAQRRDTDFLIALALICVTPTAIRYATEIKHYGFELLAALAMVLAARLVAVQSRRQMLAFAALAAVLTYCSFTIMFIAAIAMLEIALFRAEGKARADWLLVLAGFCAIWLASYFGVLRDLLHFQLLNYRDAYAAPDMSVMLDDPALLKNPLIAVIRAQPYIAGLAVIPVVLWLAMSKQVRIPPLAEIIRWAASAEAMPVRLFAMLWATLALLWIGGLFPFSSERVLLFTMPVSALLMGLLLRKVGVRLETVCKRLLLAALVFAPPLAACAVLQFKGYHEQQDTRAAYAWMKAHPVSLYVPGFLFEPTLRYYRKLEGGSAPDLRIAGWLDARSEPLASLEEVQLRLLEGRLNNHDWRVLHEGSAEGLYAHWIVRQALDHGNVHYVSAQVTIKDEAMLRVAAGGAGCVVRQEFAVRGIAIFHVICGTADQREP